MTGLETVLVDRPRPGVAAVTINRPEVCNALDVATQALLERILTDLASDNSCRCVVLTGAGDRAFCAGFDIDEMAAMTEEEVSQSREERPAWIDRITKLPLPMVTALNGATYGAGCLLALASDIRIGCERTVFRFTAALYGGLMFTAVLPPLVGRAKATEYLLTAREVTADEALQSTLLNRLFDSPKLLPAALDAAETIAANPPEGVRAIKEVLRLSEGLDHESRYALETEREAALMRARSPRHVFQDFLQGNRDSDLRQRNPKR